MKAYHYINKFIFHLKYSSLKETFKQVVFFHRKMVVIEKEISTQPLKQGSDIIFLVIDRSNYKEYSERYKLKNLGYYSKKGAMCILALKDETCVGYQWWTVDNDFIDLKKLDLKLAGSEAYLFDFYVLPEYRGTDIPKQITIETFNYLTSKNINKIYGFYFSDNIKAMWWHRAFLKCSEIKRVKVHRFFFVEFAQGRFFFNVL